MTEKTERMVKMAQEQRRRLHTLMLEKPIVKHYKGGTYVMLTAGVKEDTLELMIVYQSVEHGYVWVRGIEDWTEAVEWPDGVMRSRFVSIDQAPKEPEEGPRPIT